MIRRLLSAGVGAALMGILMVPAHVAADSPTKEQREIKTFIATLTTSPPAPLFRLRPTARRTLAGSLLFGIHPALGLLPTDDLLDVPGDHPQPTKDDDALSDIPRPPEGAGSMGNLNREYNEWDWMNWHISHMAKWQQLPAPDQNDGYVYPVSTGTDFAYRVVQESPASENETPAPTIEALSMPQEDSDVTCPYLRKQMTDRHASQIADPEIGCDVLANLERLKDADNLLDLAKELASCGFVTEAMMCCDLAAKRCPGSPCAARAVETMSELACGITPQSVDTEEVAEPEKDEPTGPCTQENALWRQLFASMGLPVKSDTAAMEPGVEPMVCGLMKACHLLMSQGMQQQAAELARQAYALDPQRVIADPLIYKMHLLAETPATTSTGASEESEPQTCPYFPSTAKPINEIVPEKTKTSKKEPTTFLVPPLPSIDYEVVPALDGVLTESAGAEEESEESRAESIGELIETMLGGSIPSPIEIGTNADGGLRVFGECSLGDNIYHLRYTHGGLAVWRTTDAGKKKP